MLQNGHGRCAAIRGRERKVKRRGAEIIKDDAKAPDYARTVDIHQKPGYDPVELFFDPEMALGKLTPALKLAKRKLGFRGLMDVISCSRTDLVKGTHGRITDDPGEGPLVISSEADLMPEDAVDATDFKRLVLDHVFT